MKKRAILSLGGVFILSLGIGSVIMYFFDMDRVVNRTAVGSNEIAIVETFEDPKPGEKTQKAPAVININGDDTYESAVDCYVRARVFLSDSRAMPYVTYYSGEKEGFNTEVWKEDNDGWLYYGAVLEKGETTEPVFTHIMMDENIAHSLSGFTIDILFESVQSDGFSNANEAFEAIR